MLKSVKIFKIPLQDGPPTIVINGVKRGRYRWRKRNGFHWGYSLHTWRFFTRLITGDGAHRVMILLRPTGHPDWLMMIFQTCSNLVLSIYDSEIATIMKIIHVKTSFHVHINKYYMHICIYTSCYIMLILNIIITIIIIMVM